MCVCVCVCRSYYHEIFMATSNELCAPFVRRASIFLGNLHHLVLDTIAAEDFSELHSNPRSAFQDRGGEQGRGEEGVNARHRPFLQLSKRGPLQFVVASRGPNEEFLGLNGMVVPTQPSAWGTA